MQVTIQTVKANLSKLIELAKAGEDIVITKGKIPVARIVPVPQGRFTIGLLKDKVDSARPDFFETVSGSEQDLWEGKG